MSTQNQYFDDLNEIRSLMEKSSRFISLSGMSGVMAGIYALIGAFVTREYISSHTSQGMRGYTEQSGRYIPDFFSHLSHYKFYLFVAGAVLGLSLLTGIFLNARSARKKGQKIWDQVALRMLVNLSIPLVSGLAFIGVLLYHNEFSLIAPAMLIFYGLGLVNGSKYTLNDIRILGLLEVVVGIICGFSSISGLYFWAFGFGVLHIVYGLYMWFKYEKG